MALVFPNSPIAGDRTTTGGRTWEFDGERWVPVGDTGYRGSVGYTGSVGDKGEVGFKGSEGYQGSEGYRGSEGYQGSVGYKGSEGYQGSEGYRGSEGYQGSVGYRGSEGYQGSVGYKGSEGNVGYQGSEGYRGSLGYQGSVGYQGSNGIASASFQNTAPTSNLLSGQLWFDTDDGLVSAYFPSEDVWVGIVGGTPGYTGSTGFFDGNTVYYFSNTVTFAQNAVVNNAFVATSLDMINYSETIRNLGNVATAQTVYISNGNIQTVTLGAASVSFTLSNTGMVDNKSYSLTLIVTQDNNGSRTISWSPNVIKWSGASAPSLSTSAYSTDIITLFTTNKGAYWYGSLSGKNFA